MTVRLQAPAAALVWVLMLGASTAASAQSQSCMYEGKRYEEGTTVCQAGLQQTCMAGTWQNLDGTRCDPGNDRKVESSGGVRIGPDGGYVAD